MKKILLALMATLALGFAGAEASSFALNNQKLAVGASHTYSFDAADSSGLVTWAQWDTYYDPRKDLTIDITSPSGFTQHCDDSFNAKQTCIIYGVLEDGEYSIKVTNIGERNVRYDIEYGASESSVQAARVAPTGTIILNEFDPDLGEVVTFSYTNSKLPKSIDLRIEVTCFQDGVMVYGSAAEAYQQVLLGGAGSDWFRSGGDADCVASLYYWDWQPVQQQVILATTSFAAGG